MPHCRHSPSLIAQILQETDERLRWRSAEVGDFSEVPDIALRMRFAMNGRGGRDTVMGLAAIQIGIPKRVIIVMTAGRHECVMVNPVLEWWQGCQTVREGCLSVRSGSYFAAKIRPRELKVKYFDAKGAPQTRRAKGLDAAVIAHEMDHLDGILFTDATA